ncbi:hypothetical protein MKJ04_22120 [Pontibacter sp. E15-1]|uniref:hypothetical protein n=1 Tax=Pontibacter sp. E15-1 TaxID=2919918 RepID=UPI001F4FDCA7|nr:hypothetical protein [Pontibacter sp. E15-1]MCJ8167555.1 hypothetical protein [Pontibacter sp. E15-1]
MKHAVLALLFIALCPLLGQAQSNYKPGFVVTAAGDTLKGYINYQEWNQAPAAIQYAASADGAGKREFTAGTARLFEITGLERYWSYDGPITMNELEARKLTTNRDMHLTNAQVFLKEQAGGEHMTLLSFTDPVKTRLFVQEKGDSLPQELYFVKYYTADAGNKVFAMRSYVGQLQLVASRYIEVTPALKREIEKANYDASSLQRIVHKINGNAAIEPMHDGKQRQKPRFYAGLGLNRSTTAFGGNHAMTGAEGNSASYMPRVAFGMDAFVNRNTQRLVLRIEGALTASSQTSRIYTSSSVYQYERTYEIAQQTATIIPQIIYNLYNKDNFKYYVGGGVGFNFSNYSKNRYSYTYRYGTDDSSTRELQAYEAETAWASYMVRTGVVLKKKYEVTAIYQPMAALTRYVDFAIQQQSLSIGMNYLFGK